MTFRELRQADIARVFLPGDGAGFDEEVVYTSKGFGSRTINAIIDEDFNHVDERGQLTANSIIWAHAARDSETGIGNPKAGDTVTFTRGGNVITGKYEGTTVDADEDFWSVQFSVQTIRRISNNAAPA